MSNLLPFSVLVSFSIAARYLPMRCEKAPHRYSIKALKKMTSAREKCETVRLEMSSRSTTSAEERRKKWDITPLLIVPDGLFEIYGESQKTCA